MDIWHRITKIIDHERGAIAGLAVFVAALSFVGCGSFDGKVVSSTTGETVDAPALEREYVLESNAVAAAINEQQLVIEAANARIAAQLQRAETLNTNADFDQQRINDELAAQQRLIDATVGAVAMAVPGSGQYLELLLGAFGVGGIATATGFGFDNRRKNKVIEQKKAEAAIG